MAIMENKYHNTVSWISTDQKMCAYMLIDDVPRDAPREASR